MSGISDKVIDARKPKTKYTILKEIGERFSPRYYSSDPIPENDMNSIFEAARLAPSARNNQPWFFYWTRNGTKTFNKLYRTLLENNRWAKTAPVFIACTYLYKNEFGENDYALYDLGASVLSLILQAQYLGYYARQMGLFDKEKAGKILKVSEYQKVFIIIALGKLGDYNNAPKEMIIKDMTSSIRKDEIAKEI